MASDTSFESLTHHDCRYGGALTSTLGVSASGGVYDLGRSR
jgi:hypothetical protein